MNARCKRGVRERAAFVGAAVFNAAFVEAAFVSATRHP
jgi:hypothetical protein